MNSPGSRDDVWLVRAASTRSSEGCEGFTTTAGLIFEPERSVNGYRTRTMSNLEKFLVDIVSAVVPDLVQRRLRGPEPEGPVIVIRDAGDDQLGSLRKIHLVHQTDLSLLDDRTGGVL